jgi:hypothetical protein
METVSQLERPLPSKTQEHSASTNALIREWLFRFGVNFEKDIAPMLPLWLEAFEGIDAETLESLFRKALTTCKFFPKVAEILEPLQAVEQSNFEDEWQALLDYCREWVHPDMTFTRLVRLPDGTTARVPPPDLPPEIDHAARAAGGLHYLRECPHEELVWRKKAFIEDLTRSRKTGDLAVLLTGGELRKFFRQASQPTKELPAPKPAERRLAIEESAPLKKAVFHNKTRKTLTPEELERQKQFILKNYPLTGKETAL